MTEDYGVTPANHVANEINEVTIYRASRCGAQRRVTSVRVHINQQLVQAWVTLKKQEVGGTLPADQT